MQCIGKVNFKKALYICIIFVQYLTTRRRGDNSGKTIQSKPKEPLTVPQTWNNSSPSFQKSDNCKTPLVFSCPSPGNRYRDDACSSKKPNEQCLTGELVCTVRDETRDEPYKNPIYGESQYSMPLHSLSLKWGGGICNANALLCTCYVIHYKRRGSPKSKIRPLLDRSPTQ